ERLAGFMLGEMRQPLAGVGRIDVLEGAAAAIERYVASLAGTPARRAPATQALLMQALEVRASLGRLEPAAALPLLLIAADVGAPAVEIDRALVGAYLHLEQVCVRVQAEPLARQAAARAVELADALERSDPADDRAAELAVAAHDESALTASSFGSLELARVG